MHQRTRQEISAPFSPKEQGVAQRSILKLRLTWLAQLSCQRAKGPDVLGVPILGKDSCQRRAKVHPFGAPTALTLSSIGLTEQFLMLGMRQPFVKGFPKFFLGRFECFRSNLPMTIAGPSAQGPVIGPWGHGRRYLQFESCRTWRCNSSNSTFGSCNSAPRGV